MSKNNRERKSLWRLGVHPKQTGHKATESQIFNAKQRAIRIALEHQERQRVAMYGAGIVTVKA